MDIHEVCDIFPMIDEGEYLLLKNDIEAHGLREPIKTYQGKIIDGRNRWRACQELGVTPDFDEWDGNGSLVDYVLSLNLHRRHLTPSQRAACAVEAEERIAKETAAIVDANRTQQTVSAGKKGAAKRHGKGNGEPIPDEDSGVASLPPRQKGKVAKTPDKPKSRDKAAAAFKTSPRNVQDAKAVKQASPELHEQVKAGKVTVNQAKRVVARTKKRADMQAKADQAAAAPDAGAPGWEVWEGDCLPLIGQLDDKSIRLVFIDPPYNQGVDYGGGFNDDKPRGEYLAGLRAVIDAAMPKLTDDGSVFVMVPDEWADHVGVMLQEAGLVRRNWLKWYETFGVNTPTKFNRTSRHIFYMVKDDHSYVFHKDAVSRPSDRQAKHNDKRADPDGKVWDDVWGINPQIPRLVENAAERIPDFPTQLPVALLMPIVGCASDPGDLVVDFYSGSGTTGEAAIRQGRRYIGMELSSDYANLQRLRLTAVRVNTDATK